MTIEEIAKKAIDEMGALQKVEELSQFLGVIDKQKPKSVVEIGTAGGGTFYAMCQVAHPDATIVSVDLPGGGFGGGHSLKDQERIRTYGQKGQVLKFIRGDSHKKSILKKCVSLFKEKIDLLFIDGDHTYEGVKQDFEMYSPLVKKGGLIAFHDICYHDFVPDCKVSYFWDEIKHKYEYGEFIDSRNTSWGGIGLIHYGEPKKVKPMKDHGLLLDISKGVVQKGFTRIEHDLEQFPWPVKDNACHVVVGAHIIEHIKPWNIMRFFDELHRIIKPSGQAVLSTPYAGSMGWWSDPTHCTGFNERSFAYLDPTQEAYMMYRPKPWRIERGQPTWRNDGNLEIVMYPVK